MLDTANLTIMMESPASANGIADKARSFLNAWLDSGGEDKTLAHYTAISQPQREELMQKVQRNFYFNLGSYEKGMYKRIAEIGLSTEYKTRFFRLFARTYFSGKAWRQISRPNSGDFKQDVSRIVTDGIRVHCALQGLSFPAEFMNRIDWDNPSVSVMCRVDPGIVTLSLDGENPRIRKGTEDGYPLLIGCRGLGWYEPDMVVVKKLLRYQTSFRLAFARPGTLLEMAGYKKINGRLPGEWTDKDLARAAITSLDSGR